MVEGDSSPSESSVAKSTDSVTARNNTHELIKAIKPQTQHINITLDDDNFLLWRFQIETVIKGYGLEHHLFVL